MDSILYPVNRSKFTGKERAHRRYEQFMPKFGFMPSYRYGIFHKNDELKIAEWSMVRELYSGTLNCITGIVDTV